MSGAGCNKCVKRISVGENEWLNWLNIPDDSNHRQVVIRINKRIKYTVDGLLPKENMVFEYNGDWYHGNPKIYNPNNINTTVNKTFGYLYKKTLEKKRHLEKMGYKVISIWESSWKDRKGLCLRSNFLER